MQATSDLIIKRLSELYGFDFEEAKDKVKDILDVTIDTNTPSGLMCSIIKEQKNKEDVSKKEWDTCVFRDILKLESNNSGNCGEEFLNKSCNHCDIESSVDGSQTKEKGGGCGDGVIKKRSVEVKTARIGVNGGFQHELGEFPWKADYMCFIDITPNDMYLTIFRNFTEVQYKQRVKAGPMFPSRSFCWRKESGCFKLDTTVKLDEVSMSQGYTLKITSSTSFDEVGKYINKIILTKEEEDLQKQIEMSKILQNQLSMNFEKKVTNQVGNENKEVVTLEHHQSEMS